MMIREQSSAVKVQPDSVGHVGALVRTVTPAPSKVVLVTDETVAPLYAAAVLDGLRASELMAVEFRAAAGEGSKSLAVAEAIYHFLAAERFGRDGVIVALGGGVVSDVAGFVAGTWMRGVRWAVCPTTLEAQIDASIGGKTAVNLRGGKNLVGVFHPPMLVVVDPNCLRTLPRRELVAGLAESVKHALITSEEFLAWHEQNAEKILALDSATMTALIERNIVIKSQIVARDPHETTGERFVLNFGHTIGHAIEECSRSHPGPLPGGEGDRLRHGECVSIGVMVACMLSQRRGWLDAGMVGRVESLLTRLGLPTRLPPTMNVGRLVEGMQLDKKARGGKVQFVLLAGIGKPVIARDVSVSDIEAELGK